MEEPFHLKDLWTPQLFPTVLIDSTKKLFCLPADKCHMPLGLSDQRVANPLMTASSSHSFYCKPFNGRLRQRRAGRKGGSWCAKRKNRRQWLQVDFEGLTRFTGVATQGRQNSHQWVTSYKLSYSRDGSTFRFYREMKTVKVGLVDKGVFRANRFQNVALGPVVQSPIRIIQE